MANTVFNVGLVSEYQVVKSTIDPSPANYNYKIGTKWVNTATDTIFEITDNTVGIAVWVKTSNDGSGSDYVTVIQNPYDVITFGTVFDSSTAKNIIWYIGLSANSASSSMSFEVNVTNDELNQDFTISSSGDITSADVQVTFPSAGNANLEIKVPNVDWKVVSKRLDIE